MSKIVKGSIVKFKSPEFENQRGYYRVSAIRGTDSVNMTGVWGGKVLHKGYPKRMLVECEAEWYSKWAKSEQYQCM